MGSWWHDLIIVRVQNCADDASRIRVDSGEEICVLTRVTAIPGNRISCCLPLPPLFFFFWFVLFLSCDDVRLAKGM